MSVPDIISCFRLVAGTLEVLDVCFPLYTLEDKATVHKTAAVKTAIKLLTLPTPPSMQMHSKALLSSLHSTKQSYHNFKDQALLQHVVNNLNTMIELDQKDRSKIDAENYYRLVMIVRSIAVARPQNLVKFADTHTSIQDVVLDDPLGSKKIVM